MRHAGQGTQRWDGIEFSGNRRFIDRGQPGTPRRKEQQFIEHGAALARQRVGPPCQLEVRFAFDTCAQFFRARRHLLEIGMASAQSAAAVFPGSIEKCLKGVTAYARIRSGKLEKDPERVVDTGQPARIDNGLICQAEQARLQSQQMAGEIAAIDGRDIHRQQRLQVLRVVPVVEMAVKARHAGHGMQGVAAALK